jgi:hypothetical protein
MKKLSELLPNKMILKCPEKAHQTRIDYADGINDTIDKVTKALDAIDPTKIRFKAKCISQDLYVTGMLVIYEEYKYAIYPVGEMKLWSECTTLSRCEIDPSTLQILIND